MISNYVEWLKNIQHKSVGRLTTKWEQKSKKMFLEGLNKKLNEKNINLKFNDKDLVRLRGGTGQDIIRSTIEGTISEALDSVFDRMRKNNLNMRTSAMSIAMERIYE